ncbi:MAG: hypothetical protein ABIH39_07230 [Candidatus Margulisiibacteriota bacterium]
MQIFDLKDMNAFPYEQRDKNVFYSAPELKTRIIQLKPGETMPECEMKSKVMFYALSGSADININNEKGTLKEGCCLISGPGLFKMSSINGTRLLGIQIANNILP